MNQDIFQKLDELRQQIKSQNVLNRTIRQSEWGGADVIIRSKLDEKISRWLGNQPSVILSYQKTAPRRRAVITQFSRELSWIFRQLGRICSEEIDYVSKYDFYGSLAQAAIDYLEHSGERSERDQLLYAVSDAARNFCGK